MREGNHRQAHIGQQRPPRRSSARRTAPDEARRPISRPAGRKGQKCWLGGTPRSR
jgi:hypothetical protein